MAGRPERNHFIPDTLLYPEYEASAQDPSGLESREAANGLPNFIPETVLYGQGSDLCATEAEEDIEKATVHHQNPEAKTSTHGKCPTSGQSNKKNACVEENTPLERPSQVICADILFLESVIRHIKDCDVQGEFVRTIITKLRGLIRQKLRSLASSGTGKCVEDSVDLLLSRVAILQRTIMDKHWDELQTLRMGPGRPPVKEPVGRSRGNRRQSRYDEVSYSPEEIRNSRRDSYESDELSSAIDRFDRFINTKYKDELKEVRRTSMPRLHRRQSTASGSQEYNLAERILRSRKSNRNEYNSPRSISGMRHQMMSPDSVYSQVSGGSAMKNFYSYERGAGPNRSPPDGGSYHEQILDIVASVNGKPNHVPEKMSLNKRNRSDQGAKSHRSGAGVQTKSNGHLSRGSEDSGSGRERYYSEERHVGLPHLDQGQREVNTQTDRKGKATVQRTRSVATQSDLSPNTRDKKKKKKPSVPAPPANRSSWMKTVSYDKESDVHKKSDDKPVRKKRDPSKRLDGKPRQTHPGRQGVTGVTSGDLPRPRAKEARDTHARDSHARDTHARDVHGRHDRFPRDEHAHQDRSPRRGSHYAEMEMTAVEDYERKYDNRNNNHRAGILPAASHGERFIDFNIVKSQGYYSDMEEDYIRQYRSLQL